MFFIGLPIILFACFGFYKLAEEPFMNLKNKVKPTSTPNLDKPEPKR
jgi:hypothetical protein